MSVGLAHRVAGALIPCATLAAALTLVACGGSSDPVIVSGKIETLGQEVDVAAYRVAINTDPTQSTTGRARATSNSEG